MMQSFSIIKEIFSYRLLCLLYRMSHMGIVPKRTILVNGIPRTGSIWLTLLLGSIPGHQRVGNFHGRMQRYLKTQPGEIIHGHNRWNSELVHILQKQEIKTIITLRDPRDHIVSLTFHLRRDHETPMFSVMPSLTDDEALMVSIEGYPGIMEAVVERFNISLSWLENNADVCLVKYESMLVNPEKEFKRILSFVSIPANDQLIKSIIQKNRFERLSVGKKIWKPVRKPGDEDAMSHFRKGISGDWKNYFKPAHVNRFKEIGGKLLIDLGYEKDFNW